MASTAVWLVHEAQARMYTYALADTHFHGKLVDAPREPYELEAPLPFAAPDNSFSYLRHISQQS